MFPSYRQQLIYRANQLTSFYMMGTLAVKRLKEKRFSLFFAPCFYFSEQAYLNAFPCISYFSAFVPFHA